MKALHEAAGSWDELERRVSRRMRAFGETGYSAAGRTAKSWGEGGRIPTGLALVALVQEFPHIPLAPYALSEAHEAPSAVQAEMVLRRGLSNQLLKLERQIAALEALAPAVGALIAVLLADRSLGPAIRQALTRVRAGGIDPVAAQYLAEAEATGSAEATGPT